MSWSQRMNLAIEYIEENLNAELDIDDVAKIACCSKYHFHRMFFASFKVTFAEYIRKRRLTLAAVEIMNGDKRIVDIALMYGYDSPNAFTRAFRNIHGINPGKVRASAVTLTSYKRAFIPEQTRAGDKMDYKIVEKPAFNVVGKSRKFEFEKFFKDAPAFWKEYVGSDDYQKLWQLNNGKSGPVTDATLLSAYFPDENGNKDEFLDVLGLELNSELNVVDFEVHKVAAAIYAEFNCSYKSAAKTNRYIYAEWFASTGYERDGSKPDIAAYFPIPFRPMNEMGVRWWIPVIRK